MMRTMEALLATYNGERYITEQVYSIYNQTQKPEKLIIQDDNSTDSTVKIIAELQETLPNWIELHVNTRRLGVAKNFSRLLERANARYIVIADQDDIWKEDKIERELEAMKQQEKISSKAPVLVHTDLELMNKDSKSSRKLLSEFTRIKGETDDKLVLALYNNCTGCTIMLNNQALRISLPIPDGIVMHDWWLCQTICKYGSKKYLKNATVRYRQHEQNTVGAKKKERIWLAKEIVRFSIKDKKSRITRKIDQIKLFRIKYGEYPEETLSLLEKNRIIRVLSYPRILRRIRNAKIPTNLKMEILLFFIIAKINYKTLISQTS